MAFETERGLTAIEIPVTAGIDEAASSTAANKKHLEMRNFRISPDGTRIQKRDGLVQLASLGSGAVYGVATYYNSSGSYCILAVTATKIWRKVGIADFSAIHTWATAVDHPVEIISIHGRQYIFTGTANVVVLENGTVVTAGIAIPATCGRVATAAPEYVFNDPFPSATGSVDSLDALWATYSSGDGLPSVATGIAYAWQSAGNVYLNGRPNLYNDSVGGMVHYFVDGSVSNKFCVEIELTLGRYDYKVGRFDAATNNRQFSLHCDNKIADLYFALDDYNMYLYNDNVIPMENRMYPAAINPLALSGTGPAPRRFKFIVDQTSGAANMTVDVYVANWHEDFIYYGQYSAGAATGGTAGIAFGSLNSLSMVHSVKVWNYSENYLTGAYRYAIAFSREGNWNYEGNVAKSEVGGITFAGAGLNDMTATGVYTGINQKRFCIKVATAGPTDTIDISEDDGATWITTGVNMAASYAIGYGITINFAATAGHTAGNMWSFIGYTFRAVALGESINLTELPVSADAQVTNRRLYRTTSDGAAYDLLATIDNTTTTYTDNKPDYLLGEELVEYRDRPPLGKRSWWWDDRLWVFDTVEEVVYYSRVNAPEEFDLTNNFVSVRTGRQYDRGTALRPLGDHMYAFKRASAFRISPRLDGSYARYLVSEDIGCDAGNSIIEVAGQALYFKSARGIEEFRGEFAADALFSMPAKDTLATVNMAYDDLITACHARKYNELWFSFPDRTGVLGDIVLVYNYASQAFYTFRFHKVGSFFGEALDSSFVQWVYMGTRDGYVFTCDSGPTDGSTAIDAYLRARWFRYPIKELFRKLEIEYELTDTYKLLVDLYVDMENIAQSASELKGNTPSGTDAAIRRPIWDQKELFIAGQYASLKFRNAEAVGSDLKINSVILYQAHNVRKNRIEGT